MTCIFNDVSRWLFGRREPRPGRRTTLVSLTALIAMSMVVRGLESKPASGDGKPAVTSASPPPELIAAARDRAKLLHEVYSATLDVMHHRYFRRDGPVLPAKAMEDIFEEMGVRSGTMANWIAVNTKAMSINHEPTTAFEKLAAAEISAGKESIERVTRHVYQRATMIPLKANCVGCHTKMFSEEPKTPRFAGLVISVPLIVEKK